MAKPIDIQAIINLIPSIPIGTKLFLRKGALPAANLREFRFKSSGEKGRIILSPETGIYDWETNIEYIDWERYLEENPQAAESSSSDES
jgi:hypothetical protein